MKQPTTEDTKLGKFNKFLPDLKEPKKSLNLFPRMKKEEQLPNLYCEARIIPKSGKTKTNKKIETKLIYEPRGKSPQKTSK